MADEAPAADTGGDFDASLAAALAEGGDAAAEETESVEASTEDTGEETPEGGEGEKAEAKGEKSEKKEPDKKPDEKKEPEKDEKAEARKEFQALARERAKLREREQALAAKETALKDIEPKARAHDELVKLLKEDPAAAVLKVGGQEAIDKVLDGIVASEKSPAEREVERLRKDLEAKEAAERQREQVAQVDRWKNSVKEAVVAAGERFDLVNALGQHDTVVEVITQYYAANNGHVLPTEQAAEIVEKYLAQGLAKSKKFVPRGDEKPAQPSNGTPAPAKKKSNTTLSSVATREVPPADDDLPLDPDARFERVMAGLPV